MGKKTRYWHIEYQNLFGEGLTKIKCNNIAGFQKEKMSHLVLSTRSTEYNVEYSTLFYISGMPSI
jgi:hypothetical protein